MMRPIRIKGARALDYYLQIMRGREAGSSRSELERGRVEDYYLPAGDPESAWFGRGAQALGLKGPGTRKQMAALLEAKHPQSGQALGRQRPGANSVRAYDLTFSAPKSVSVLAMLLSIGGESLVVRAHDEAVRAALSLLEERASVRGGKNGHERLPVTGITALEVRHRTSRMLDPQLHTHVLLFARAQTHDGRWLALNGEILFRAQRTFGALYQSALRSELTRCFGVQWTAVEKGQAEIKGLEELSATFSKRSEQVARAFKQKLGAWEERHPGHTPTPRQEAILRRDAARESRPAKERGAPDATLALQWRRIAKDLDWDDARIRREVLGRVRVQLPDPHERRERLAEVASEAVRALSEEKSVWTLAELEREVAARMPVHYAREPQEQVRAIKALAKEVAEHLCVDLVAAAGGRELAGDRLLEDPGLERYTTPELIAQEHAIVSWFDGARALGGQRASEAATAVAYGRISTGAEVPALDPEQTEAAALVAGSHRAVAIVGPAGAGKTQMLALAVAALHAKRRRVVGVAPSSIAEKRLHEATRVPCETVDKFLEQQQLPTEQQRLELRVGRGDTLIVDEAGMMKTPHWSALLERANAVGFRVVFVGDPRQLSAVGRGGMFDHATERLEARELGRVHRFSSPWEAVASLRLRGADPKALDRYIANDRVRSGSAAEMKRAMVKDWWSSWRAGTSAAFHAPTNEQVRELNDAARERRIEAGELSAERTVRGAGGQVIGVGDLVATRHNARALQLPDGSHVRNRETWTVVGVARDGGPVLRAADGRGEVEVPAAYARKHVELGYFKTTHGVQGTTERVGGTIVDERSGFRSVYVGMTRGRKENTAYVVCEDGDKPREVMQRALMRDRADLGVLAQRRAIEERVRERERARERERRSRRERALAAGARGRNERASTADLEREKRELEQNQPDRRRDGGPDGGLGLGR